MLNFWIISNATMTESAALPEATEQRVAFSSEAGEYNDKLFITTPTAVNSLLELARDHSNHCQGYFTIDSNPKQTRA